MHVTEIPIHKLMGMRLAAAGEPDIVELPEAPLLFRRFGCGPSKVFAAPRTSKVKFRRPAHGNLRASARLEEKSGASPTDQLASRGHALTAVLVEVMDANDVVTMSGRYDWFLRRQTA
jgi:hypothetical protein